MHKLVLHRGAQINALRVRYPCLFLHVALFLVQHWVFFKQDDRGAPFGTKTSGSKALERWVQMGALSSLNLRFPIPKKAF